MKEGISLEILCKFGDLVRDTRRNIFTFCRQRTDQIELLESIRSNKRYIDEMETLVEETTFTSVKAEIDTMIVQNSQILMKNAEQQLGEDDYANAEILLKGAFEMVQFTEDQDQRNSLMEQYDALLKRVKGFRQMILERFDNLQIELCSWEIRTLFNVIQKNIDNNPKYNEDKDALERNIVKVLDRKIEEIQDCESEKQRRNLINNLEETLYSLPPWFKGHYGHRINRINQEVEENVKKYQKKLDAAINNDDLPGLEKLLKKIKKKKLKGSFSKCIHEIKEKIQSKRNEIRDSLNTQQYKDAIKSVLRFCEYCPHCEHINFTGQFQELLAQIKRNLNEDWYLVYNIILNFTQFSENEVGEAFNHFQDFLVQAARLRDQP